MELFDPMLLEEMDYSTHQLSHHETISFIIFQGALGIWRTFLLWNSEQFQLIAQHLGGFHPSAIEHGGHVGIAMVLLFSFVVSDYKGHHDHHI